jgi:hypothetical protein
MLGESAGFLARIRATTPEATGQEAEVPLKYV